MVEPVIKKKPPHSKKSQGQKFPLISAMIGCMILSVSLTGALFWEEISKNQNILNLIGSLSIFKEEDEITYENSSPVLINKDLITPPTVLNRDEQDNSTENRVEAPKVLRKGPILSEKEYVTANEVASVQVKVIVEIAELPEKVPKEPLAVTHTGSSETVSNAVELLTALPSGFSTLK